MDYIDEDTKESFGAGHDVNKSATEIITSAFEQFHAIMNESHPADCDALASLLYQEAVLGVIRAMLDDPYGLIEAERSSTIDLTLYLDYLRASYSAKYRLNRHLSETQKNKNVTEEKRCHKPGCDPLSIT